MNSKKAWISVFVLLVAIAGFGLLSSGASPKHPDVEEVTARTTIKLPGNAFVINMDGSCTWKDYIRVFNVRNVESVQGAYDAVKDDVKLGVVVKSGVRKEYEQYSRRCSRIEIRKIFNDDNPGFEVFAFYDPVEVPSIKLK